MGQSKMDACEEISHLDLANITRSHDVLCTEDGDPVLDG